MGENIDDIKQDFETGLLKLYVESKSNRSTLLLESDYQLIICEVKEAQRLRKSGESLSSKQYRRLKRYDLLNIGQDEKLIAKRRDDNDDIKFYVYNEQLFDIVHAVHINTGHKREKVMEHELKKKYVNITREVINLYLRKCKVCKMKKGAPKKGIFVKPNKTVPITPKYLNSRCQINFIDMQTEPDEPYKFILIYQDYLTKFLLLRPLITNTVQEVANNLLDIFCMLGAPFILESSSNGREFASSITSELALLWPGLKLVHGQPRQSFIKGAIEDIRELLSTWLEENNTTKWSEGLRFIQSRKNRTFHEELRKSPHEAMFGTRQINGLGDADLPNILGNLQSEEDLEDVLQSRGNKDYPEGTLEQSAENLERTIKSEVKDEEYQEEEINESKLDIVDYGNPEEGDDNLNCELFKGNKRLINEREESHKKIKIESDDSSNCVFPLANIPDVNTRPY